MLLKLKRTPGIYLVGFMGCGKSTVGRALAGELGWSFFDLDAEIERREGLPIAEIFEMRGEISFRQAESAALHERVKAVQIGRPQVISLGGGTFLPEDNFDLISNHGVTIWLDVPLDVIVRRVEGFAHRPLARNPERLKELYEARRPGYARADYRLEIADDDVVQNVARIMDLPLLTASTRHHALQIFRAALAAADPFEAVLRHLACDGRVLRAGPHRYPLSAFDRIQVIGAGKAGAAMAGAVERVLGARLASGLVNVPDGKQPRLRRVQLRPCGHPVPDERGQAAASEILEIARHAGPRDLLICVISGGASALLPVPAPPLTLADKQTVTRKLLTAGANIHELNSVRKHLSAIKGGQLARAAQPARVLALLLSDVIGDDLDVIGSGPTVPDPSTTAEALALLHKYSVQLSERLLHETPKPGDPAFAGVQNLIVGSNRLAIDGAARKARELGYRTLVLSSSIDGETRDVARVHAAIAREILERTRSSGRSKHRPTCVLSGGETTVTVRGRGLGGRNQEFVLAAGIALQGVGGIAVFSAGTDGIDGPTPAAGAIADARTIENARAQGLDPQAYLDNNDSYRFFERAKALVMTGPTGTNVMDIRLMLIQ